VHCEKQRDPDFYPCRPIGRVKISEINCSLHVLGKMSPDVADGKCGGAFAERNLSRDLLSA